MVAATNVLYYPNFDTRAIPGIKAALLLYDDIHLVAPASTPFIHIAREDGRAEERAIAPLGAQLPLSPHIHMISDYTVVREHRGEFMEALQEDLFDPEVRQWAAQRRHNQSWLINEGYVGQMGEGLVELLKLHFPMVDTVAHNRGVELYRVPFLVGMSLALSESLWSAVENGYALYTDDETSEEFLMLRLKRGWHRLSQDVGIRRSLDIEDAFGQRLAAAQIGTWTLGLQMPELFNRIAEAPVEAILQMREDADRGGALQSFREGLDRIVSSSDLWRADSFKAFEEQSRDLVKSQLLPHLEELEQRKIVSVSEIVQAHDAETGLKKMVGTGRDLFIRSAVPATSFAAAVAVFSQTHLNWTAVLGLLGSLGVGATIGAVERLGERLKTRREARFMTYPVRLRSALSQSTHATHA